MSGVHLLRLVCLLAASNADAGLSAPVAAPDGGCAAVGFCAAEQARLDRRVSWLRARREEQFARGGPPDPARAVPNMIGVFCEGHPSHEECQLGNVTLTATTEELAWSRDKTPEDYDAHVVLMKRALKSCLARQRR